jgi:hypothetical protein
MRAIFSILLIAMAVLGAVHLYFYWAVGTVDPCRAAVLRIVQKEREAGRDLTAGLGVLFRQQLEDALRSEGIATCYRSALRGEAPELELRLNRPR